MEYYFYKKLTLVVKLNKKGKSALKVVFFFSYRKTNLCGVENVTVKKQETEKESRILILNVSVNGSEYILINLYNANTKKEQTNVFSNMFVLSQKFDINKKNEMIMAGDFNLFFDSKLDVRGGNSTIKKNSLSKLIELKESYELCDIWRVRDTKSRQFTFTQKHSSDFIQRRLDYILISNTLQELVTTTETVTPISTDHSPVLFSLSKGKDCLRGKGFWKFNSSLTKDQNYITEIRKLILSFCTTNESFFKRQLKWEFLKYEVRKLTINYKKTIAK